MAAIILILWWNCSTSWYCERSTWFATQLYAIKKYSNKVFWQWLWYTGTAYYVGAFTGSQDWQFGYFKLKCIKEIIWVLIPSHYRKLAEFNSHVYFKSFFLHLHTKKLCWKLNESHSAGQSPVKSNYGLLVTTVRFHHVVVTEPNTRISAL